MRHENTKGFTLVELLIVIAITTTIGTVMTLTGAKASASQRVTNIIHGLVNCKRAVLSLYADNPDSLPCGDMTEEVAKYLKSEIITLKDGVKHIKGNSADEGYLTNAVCNVVKPDGRKVDQLFIEYYSPSVNFDEDVLKGLARYAKTLKLYKSPEDLSDENLISDGDVRTPFYMLVREVPSE